MLNKIKVDSATVREDKLMNKIKETEDEALVWVSDVKALVCIGKEIVVLLKCFLVVFVCSLLLAGYVTFH